LKRLFVHAYHGNRRIVRAAIYFKNILHCRHKSAVSRRGNAPVPAQVRLKFIFFKVLFTVMWEMESI
jgi:hypothetical protein